MTWAAAGSGAWDVCGFDAAFFATRSRRRAHLGGRSVDGKTQSMFARRQLEHGDCLSQRTFRVRQTTQLRSFGPGVDVDAVEWLLTDEGDVAFFSEGETEESPPVAPEDPVAADILTDGICDMIQSKEYCKKDITVVQDLPMAESALRSGACVVLGILFGPRLGCRV